MIRPRCRSVSSAKAAGGDTDPAEVTTNRHRLHDCRLADVDVPLRVKLGGHVQRAQRGYGAGWIRVDDLVVDVVHLNPPPANAPPSAPGRLDRTADAHQTPPDQVTSVGRPGSSVRTVCSWARSQAHTVTDHSSADRPDVIEPLRWLRAARSRNRRAPPISLRSSIGPGDGPRLDTGDHGRC
jgi:hypothetical protein